MVSFVDALETNEIAVLLYTIQAPAKQSRTRLREHGTNFDNYQSAGVDL
jgi:hypothetical protein